MFLVSFVQKRPPQYKTYFYIKLSNFIYFYVNFIFYNIDE